MPAGISDPRQPPAQRRVPLFQGQSACLWASSRFRFSVSRRPNGVYLYFVFDHLEAQLPVEEVKNPVGINAGRGGVRWGFSDGKHGRDAGGS